MRLNALKKQKTEQVNRFMNNLTDEQKHEVMVSLYSHTYAEIFEIIMNKKWTQEMFVYYCRELHREGEESAYIDAGL